MSPEAPRTLVIDGARVHGIRSFFDEINRVFMADESWDLGASLDALDDMLYGGYGAASGDGPVTIVWTDAAHSRAALGTEATRAYYREKLAHPQTFDTARFTRQLAEFEAGTGPSYFDTVLAIFASHPRLRLVLEEGAGDGFSG